MSLIILPEAPRDLVGRILALNLQAVKRFQCGGFWLNPSRPWAVVDPGTQQEPLQRALLDGRLMDITDQNIKGLDTPQGGHSVPKEAEEKGAKVYIQIDNKGNVLVIAPNGDAEEDRFEAELKEKGTLSVEHYDVAESGLGGEGKVDSGNAGEILNTFANKLDDTKSRFYVSKLK